VIPNLKGRLCAVSDASSLASCPRQAMSEDLSINELYASRPTTSAEVQFAGCQAVVSYPNQGVRGTECGTIALTALKTMH
jgi:hypothetical protein